MHIILRQGMVDMRDFVERFKEILHKMWKTMEFYFSLSSQADFMYPYQSCSGFQGYIYSPVKVPMVYRKIPASIGERKIK